MKTKDEEVAAYLQVVGEASCQWNLAADNNNRGSSKCVKVRALPALPHVVMSGECVLQERLQRQFKV